MITLPGTPLPPDLVQLAHEHGDGTPRSAAPRDAATVILMAPSESPEDGPSIYYLRRQASMEFAAVMAVHPGGALAVDEGAYTLAMPQRLRVLAAGRIRG